MLQRSNAVDSLCHEIAPCIAQKRKAEFGQFMTPSSIARFMAEMFPFSSLQTCRLLDAGAGLGALSCAFLDRWVAGGFGFKLVEATAYEIDSALSNHLKRRLAGYNDVKSHVIADDYIKLVTDEGLHAKSYTHVILNPPYKKINSHSAHRQALRTVGIETVNLYSAFVALSVAQVVPGGQIVAIIPRSFCNGPYYRSFRNFILKHTAICHIHLFASRRKAFKDDDVLQENVIIRLERGGQQGSVMITTSTDDSFVDLATSKHSFDRIVLPNDPERFIHIPTTTGKSAVELLSAVRYTLADLGISVSTGPVVDFRLKEYLRNMPEADTVPLIYSTHLSIAGTVWPVMGLKKMNAIQRNDVTEKWLYPSGFYCAVRRFSSKEQKRRVVASVIEPASFGDHSLLGFENHLNLFHTNKRGLPELLARGLAVFLNMTAVDENFRRFNGHTQVNATDLKLMKYPGREALMQLGKWATRHDNLTQEMIDGQIQRLA